MIALLSVGLRAQEPVAQDDGTVASGPAPVGSSPGTLTLGDRLRIYGKSTFGPSSAVGPALGAAWGQWRDSPFEWRQGAEGYGRRFASAYGRQFIAHTIGLGISIVDHEDPRYFRSHERGMWPRVRHAAVQTFVSRTDSGGRMFAFSRVAGVYGAAFISNAWYPGREADFGHALARGSSAMGASVAFNMVREFGPDIKKRLRHR